VRYQRPQILELLRSGPCSLDSSPVRAAAQFAFEVGGEGRTIQIQAGRQTITAADPRHTDLRQTLESVNRPN